MKLPDLKYYKAEAWGRGREGYFGNQRGSGSGKLALGINTWVLWEICSLVVGRGLLPRVESVSLVAYFI